MGAEPSRTLEPGEPLYSPRRLMFQLPVSTCGCAKVGRSRPLAMMCTLVHAGASARRIHSPSLASGTDTSDIWASPNGETRYSNSEPEYNPNSPPILA